MAWPKRAECVLEALQLKMLVQIIFPHPLFWVIRVMGSNPRLDLCQQQPLFTQIITYVVPSLLFKSSVHRVMLVVSPKRS